MRETETYRYREGERKLKEEEDFNQGILAMLNTETDHFGEEAWEYNLVFKTVGSH